MRICMCVCVRVQLCVCVCVCVCLTCRLLVLLMNKTESRAHPARNRFPGHILFTFPILVSSPLLAARLALCQESKGEGTE